ncbi:hypothetical protein [Candidatus Thiosymbion oneisti]|uniref:hypothetical protein n=1 Tax=Candidatus Thiosymbion oneisti TaxID=589554 RepID=UPI001061DAFC|nr:hypothetical protein [Candidatus Thiosymbion oneisti]
MLDECVNWRFLNELPEYTVKTVRQMGWSGLKNGELLDKAQHKFDVLITTDKNIKYQQNLSEYDISVIVLDVRINDLEHIQSLVPWLKESLLLIGVYDIKIIKETKINKLVSPQCSNS